MSEINSTVLVGRLTRDAELKYTKSGIATVRMSLAWNRRKKEGDTWKDEVSYFDAVTMGKGAEGVHKYLTKGKQIGVQGELRQDRWEQDGQTRSKIYIFAFTIQLLGSRDQGGSHGGNQSADQRAQDAGFSTNADDFSDDIPF